MFWDAFPKTFSTEKFRTNVKKVFAYTKTVSFRFLNTVRIFEAFSMMLINLNLSDMMPRSWKLSKKRLRFSLEFEDLLNTIFFQKRMFRRNQHNFERNFYIRRFLLQICKFSTEKNLREQFPFIGQLESVIWKITERNINDFPYTYEKWMEKTTYISI